LKANQNTLKILHAGELRKPIKECIHILWERYPALKVELDYAGSRACAQSVAEGKIVDVLALAEYQVFDELLIPQFAETAYIFATDQMVLAFDEFSNDSDKVNQSNWMDVLLGDPAIKYGLSDYRLDPCGYRTLMLWQLAEQHYARPGLYNKLINGAGKVYAKSLDLAVALLEGQIDYGFAYRSVAKQMNLQFLQFPVQINLSDPRLADRYARATVVLEGDYPGEKTELRGTPIEFAVAIPKTTNQKQLAQEFIDILTGPRGEGILEANGLIPC